MYTYHTCPHICHMCTHTCHTYTHLSHLYSHLSHLSTCTHTWCSHLSPALTCHIPVTPALTSAHTSVLIPITPALNYYIPVTSVLTPVLTAVAHTCTHTCHLCTHCPHLHSHLLLTPVTCTQLSHLHSHLYSHLPQQSHLSHACHPNHSPAQMVPEVVLSVLVPQGVLGGPACQGVRCRSAVTGARGLVPRRGAGHPERQERDRTGSVGRHREPGTQPVGGRGVSEGDTQGPPHVLGPHPRGPRQALGPAPPALPAGGATARALSQQLQLQPPSGGVHRAFPGQLTRAQAGLLPGGGRGWEAPGAAPAQPSPSAERPDRSGLSHTRTGGKG